MIGTSDRGAMSTAHNDASDLRVKPLLVSLPGIGKVRAEQILPTAGIHTGSAGSVLVYPPAAGAAPRPWRLG